jgi:hypothetical protein
LTLHRQIDLVLSLAFLHPPLKIFLKLSIFLPRIDEIIHEIDVACPSNVPGTEKAGRRIRLRKNLFLAGGNVIYSIWSFFPNKKSWNKKTIQRELSQTDLAWLEQGSNIRYKNRSEEEKRESTIYLIDRKEDCIYQFVVLT